MENDLEQGEKLFADGEAEEAEVIFLELLAKEPTNPEVLNNLGVLCHAREDIEKAENYFLKASEAQDDYLEALLNLAGLYQEAERWEDTAALLEKCITLNPREANFHLQLGRVYLEMDNSEKARITLTRVLELDPNQVAVREILDALQNKNSASSISTQANRRPPTVSIGIPVYNMEKTVQKAIDSILNQTFSDFELIICDNASDDGTGEICRAAARKDSRISYHRNSVNILAENFRLLVLLSKGKYFMWSGARHFRTPEMLARCVEALDTDTNAILAYTHIEIIDPETGAVIKYSDPYRLDQENPAERYVSLIQNLNLGNAIYGLFRKSTLLTIPPLCRVSPHFLIYTDAIFLQNAVLQGKVIQVPKMLKSRIRDKSKAWMDNVAHCERSYFTNYLTNGVTLPISESIQEHVRYLMISTLQTDTKLELAKATYEIYFKRFGNLLLSEIDRSVDLAEAGKFTETWNGAPEPHQDEKVQDLIDQYYAGLLLDRLERTSKFILNSQRLHLGKAFCLTKMGRRREANLEFALSKELETQETV